jgi:hypothetical protein
VGLDSSHKADELIRLLGELGQAQEYGGETGDLSDLAARLHEELAQELAAQLP